MTLFHPDVESEYLAPIDYYCAIENRLAARFADAVEAAIVRSLESPGGSERLLREYACAGLLTSPIRFY